MGCLSFAIGHQMHAVSHLSSRDCQLCLSFARTLELDTMEMQDHSSFAGRIRFAGLSFENHPFGVCSPKCLHTCKRCWKQLHSTDTLQGRCRSCSTS